MIAGLKTPRKYSAVWVIALTLFCAPSAGAADGHFLFDRLTTRDGLSHSNVRSILQDRDGYMWFGTMDGLTRYDGDGPHRHDPFR